MVMTEPRIKAFAEVDDVKRTHQTWAAERHETDLFDPSVVKMWALRFPRSIIFPTSQGAFFVTSERYNPAQSRRYTVRFATLSGKISTIGGFREYADWNSALNAAQIKSLTFADGCQACRRVGHMPTEACLP